MYLDHQQVRKGRIALIAALTALAINAAWSIVYLVLNPSDVQGKTVLGELGILMIVVWCVRRGAKLAKWLVDIVVLMITTQIIISLTFIALAALGLVDEWGGGLYLATVVLSAVAIVLLSERCGMSESISAYLEYRKRLRERIKV